MSLVYLVEDDENICELVCYTLNNSGFSAMGFLSASKFYDSLKNTIPNIILLDIMLPDKDGISILSDLKKNVKTQNIPVIMLTAKSTEMDKIKGLDSGADDFITKPFSVMELISRIKAVLRRVSPQFETLKYGDVEINLKNRRVTANNENIILTYKELELLIILIQNKGMVLSRDVLLNDIWGYDFKGETRTVDVHIRTLRQKLGESGNFIETVRNIGYMVV